MFILFFTVLLMCGSSVLFLFLGKEGSITFLYQEEKY